MLLFSRYTAVVTFFLTMTLWLPGAEAQKKKSSSYLPSFSFESLRKPSSTTSSWIRCAQENGVCSFSGTRQVRYGLSGKYAYRIATGSIRCSNDVFGDPYVGANKVCDYQSSTTTSPLPEPQPQPQPLPQPEPQPQPLPQPSQSTALMLSSPELTVAAGSAGTLGMRFQAVPMPEDYQVFVHFVSSSNQQMPMGADHSPSVPTSRWSGAVSYNHQFQVPASIPTGTYSIRIGLYRNVAPYTTRIKLALGSGVQEDEQTRYIVGSLRVTAPVQQPQPQPLPQPLPQPQPQPPTSGAGPFGQDASLYEPTFSDEFNSTSLNRSVWNDTIWYESAPSTVNYAVEDGKLKIWPARNSSGQFFNRTIDTDGKYYQTYGFFEIEAKLPYGKGTWPAFWLFNHIGDRRPEIDIMEAYAGGGPNSGWSDANLHPTAFAATVWITIDQQHGHKVLQTTDLSAGFHKYACRWEPNQLIFYFDGKEFWRTSVAFRDPMYLMLDLWFGSASGQPDSSTPTGKSNSYEINYIRAWRFK